MSTATLDTTTSERAAETPVMLAVSYLRVSTREQAERGCTEEGFSIPAQREANARKADELGARHPALITQAVGDHQLRLSHLPRVRRRGLKDVAIGPRADQRLHRQIGQALGRGRRLSCNECAHHQLLNLAGGL